MCPVRSVASINNARLRLFGRLNSTEATNVPTQVAAAADTTWSESSVTWNTRPAASLAAGHGNGHRRGRPLVRVGRENYLRAEKAVRGDALEVPRSA